MMGHYMILLKLKDIVTTKGIKIILTGEICTLRGRNIWTLTPGSSISRSELV